MSASSKNLRRACALCRVRHEAHLRREFYDLFKPDGSTPVAAEALRRIAEIYQAEKETRGCPPDERVMILQEKLKPLLEAFRSWGMDQLCILMSNARVPGPYAMAWSAGTA